MLQQSRQAIAAHTNFISLHMKPQFNPVNYNVQGSPAKVRPTYIFDGNI